MESNRRVKFFVGLGLAAITTLGLRTDVVRADWSMVAGNPQRTSWTAEQVAPAPVEWYRVIEPYIGQHVQPVMAATTAYPNGLVFVSTSKGMYTYRADTGALVWSFPTELPLGNSPTYSSGVIYVGSFNRNLYALNADTGAVVWTYTGAKSGFDTNPLVVDGNVISGNRDGAIYAVNASNGALAWKYQTGGPVRFSSAYKGGMVYTVSNDGYIYANQSSSGALAWKSQTQFSDGKMRGDGFYSYWPVVYTDTGGTGKDYVLVAGSEGYRAFDRPGTQSLNALTSCGSYEWCEWLDEWNGNASGTLGNVISSESWALGRQEVNFIDTLSEYFATGGTSANGHYYKPWRRFFYVFDASNGQEYSMPSKDGSHVTYLPADPILSNSGDIYPPVIGSDNLIYLGNHWDASSQSRIMGWKFGTSKMVIQGLQQAGDEPYALSAGGNLIYRNICCDRAGDSAAISGSGSGSFWNYDISDRAPGYDNMWWGSDWNQLSRLYGSYGRLSTLLGGGLSVNGIYHEHGDQNPLIPFKGRVYTLKSNALIVFGSAGGARNLPKQTYTTAVSSLPDYGIDLSELKSRLETEVQKIVTAGHLRPGYYNAGMFANSYPWLNDYFSAPGDTMLAMSMAYPYLSTSLQAQVKTYLANEFANFDVINWRGARREWLTLPPEVESDMAGSAPAEGQVDKYYVYALWKYAVNVAPENKTAIIAKANSIRGVSSALGSANLSEVAANRNAAGDVGWAGLNGTSTAVSSCNWFSRNSSFGAVSGQDNMRSVNASRNFMFLVPEVGDCMSRNSTITGVFPEYEWLAPFWFVSRYEASVSESTMQNLYDYPSLFAAKAYIQKLPREQLVKYLDVPAFKVGDLFYIQNLVASIQAPTSGNSPTSTPTPLISPVLAPGDANGDGHIDGLDYVIWLNHYGGTSSGAANGDFNNDSRVDGLDYVIWLNNYGSGSVITPTSTPGPQNTPTSTPIPGIGGPPGPISNWTQTFSDEFTGSGLDRTKWATKYAYDSGRGDRSNNDENEWYVDNAGTLSGGILTITAKRECRTTGSDIYAPYNCTTYPYTSGIISSHNRFSQKYGYFEARIKNPSGQGVWPAFWLLPNPVTPPSLPPEPTPWPDANVVWPPEIDIMENVGQLPNVIRLNNIYSSAYPAPGNQANNWGANYDELFSTTGDTTNYSADYHIYGFDWEPGYMDWYIDGVLRHHVTTHVPPGSLSPGNMYMLLNLAVGGTTGGDPTNTTFPKQLLVDYVRAYQNNSNLATTTSAPTPTSVAATPTLTPVPGGIQTINFNDQPVTVNTPLNGVYPTGVINWGSGVWSLSPPWDLFTTTSVFFTVTSSQFSFVAAKTLTSVDVYNGGTGNSTVSLACSGNTTVTQTVAVGQMRTIQTSWATPCTTVTVGASNGESTNFDNFSYR